MLLLRWSLSSLSQVEGWHAPAGRRTCEPRPLAQDGQIRPAPPVGAVNLGPGRRIVLQDSPHGVSRLGSQAGTQAPDPTPVSAQNRGSRAGSTIHSLPAEYLPLSGTWFPRERWTQIRQLCAGTPAASTCRWLRQL